MKCRDHPSMPAEYFCSPHAAPICANCAVFEHEDCAIDDLHVYEHQTRLINIVTENIRQLQLVDTSVYDQIAMETKLTKNAQSTGRDKTDSDPKRLDFLVKSHEWYSELLNEASCCLDVMKLKRGHQSVEAKEAEDLLTKVNRKLNICLDKNVRQGVGGDKQAPALVFRDRLGPERQEGDLDDRGVKGWVRQTEQTTANNDTDDVGAPRSLVNFSAWSSDDEHFCLISGLQFLHNNHLLLADGNNQKLKLMSPPAFILLKSVRVPSSPFDVTQLADKSIAVSFPKESLVRMYNVDLEEMPGAIQTDQPCLGISAMGDFLYVFCQSTWACADCIKVFGDSGYLHASIPTNYCGARYITTLGPWSDGVVFTQTTKHRKSCLSCITPSANQIWNESLQDEWDIVNGVSLLNKAILVCTSQQVRYYRHKGRHWGTLLGPEDIKWPRAISVTLDKSMVAISQVSPFFECQENNVVVVAKFS